MRSKQKRYSVEFKNQIIKEVIEAFHRILEDECLSRYEFESFAHAYKIVSEFFKVYNKVRIHSSIGYLSPNEYYAKVLDNTNGCKAIN